MEGTRCDLHDCFILQLASHQRRHHGHVALLVAKTQLSTVTITPSKHRAVCCGADCVRSACCDMRHLFALQLPRNRRWYSPILCVTNA